ncbi:MAG: hypothetical protein HKN33_13675 [Pyrinomonadaceae bacterium]|nr:hypothetical protein [Pyrinomonadaceae bacterium]
MDKNTPKIFEQLREEALDLEMADKFLASVEQKNCLASGSHFDANRLHDALTHLASNDSSGEIEEEKDFELIAESELASWREVLEQRNSVIETYHIRRFYDESEKLLDIGLLVSLARVFRSLPFSECNLSKYDLIVTRLFTKGSSESMRSLRVTRENIADGLTVLMPGKPVVLEDEEAERIVGDLDRFNSELKPLSDLQEFVDKDSFEALRQYKKDLGQDFFDPRVTAAAIECNVTIGNVFAGLVNHINGPLFDLINNKFDFAGAFHDVSSSAETRIWDDVNNPVSEDQSSMGSQDREKIRKIFEMIRGHKNAGDARDGQRGAPASPAQPAGLEHVATNRVNEFLLMLSDENPDYQAIREELGNNGLLMSIDLEYVLAGQSETVNEICRGVLALMIWAEELFASKLHDGEFITDEAESQATALIRLCEKYQSELQVLIENVGWDEKTRLLTVSNKLLASHLDLKQIPIEYSQNRVARVEAEKEDLEGWYNEVEEQNQNAAQPAA